MHRVFDIYFIDLYLLKYTNMASMAVIVFMTIIAITSKGAKITTEKDLLKTTKEYYTGTQHSFLLSIM